HAAPPRAGRAQRAWLPQVGGRALGGDAGLASRRQRRRQRGPRSRAARPRARSGAAADRERASGGGMIRRVALATVLLTSAPAARAAQADPPSAPAVRAVEAGPPSAPAAPLSPVQGKNIVYLMSVDGEPPPDSSSRVAFVAGVRAVFDADHYPTERSPARGSRTAHSGPAALSLPLDNHFQLVRGDAFGDEWQV